MASCSVCGESLPATTRSNPVNSNEFRSESVAVFDIDNTILDSSQRFQDAYRAGLTDKDGNAKKKKALETMGKAVKRRNEFLYKPTNLAKDKVIAGSQALINDLIAKGYVIAYLTARPAQFHTETYNQLEEKGFPIFRDNSGEILLRTKGALGVKRSTYKTSELVKLSQQYDVRMFFDDDKDTLSAVASENMLDIPGLYSSIKEYRQYHSRSNPSEPALPRCANDGCLRPANGTDGYGFCMPCEDDASENRLTDPSSPYTRDNLMSKSNPPVKPRRKKMKNGKYRKEPAKKYIDRFMGNSKMVSEFPDRGQRYAVSLRYVEKFYGKRGLDSVGARQNPAPNCGCGQTPCVTYGTRSNPEEYSENYMVPRDIHRLGKAADRLEDTYEDGQEVPEWWKSKLSVTADGADKLADNLDYVGERSNPSNGIIAKHCILELYDCDPKLLDDEPFIRNMMTSAVQSANMQLLNLATHQFEPQGVTGLALLGESHISIHTWPESGYAMIDVLTCGDPSMPDKACELMRKKLKAKDHKMNCFLRDTPPNMKMNDKITSNPRKNPSNPKKVEKAKKLYKYMNGQEPEKIEKKKIDMGDVWYQVGEGGCWQIGYMSGKETGSSDQKYTHTFNEETKDGNFPKLYATMPENGKPLLIIQGGTWKIKTDDQGVAWIYD